MTWKWVWLGEDPALKAAGNTTLASAGSPKRLPQAAEVPPLPPEQARPGACLRGALGGWGGRGLGQWPAAWRGEAGSGIDRDLGVNPDSATNKVYVGGKPCNPLSLKLLCKIRQRGRRGLRDLRRSGHRAPAVTVPGLWGGSNHTVLSPWRPRDWTNWKRNKKTGPHCGRATGKAGTEGLQAQSQEEGIPVLLEAPPAGPRASATDKKPSLHLTPASQVLR